MGRLRQALNKGGEDHFAPANRKRPFTSDRAEYQFPKLEQVPNGPAFASIVLMAFEKALESGGWRADVFRKWFKNNIVEMKVELVQTIEGRLYPVMRKSSGRIMPERDYLEWYGFLQTLRKYLYGI